MISDKFPDKAFLCSSYLQKENWTALDVIQVNEILFGADKKKLDKEIDRMHRAYDKQSIRKILLYQQKNKLNNIELARKYNLSRNTVAKWKKLFSELFEVNLE